MNRNDVSVIRRSESLLSTHSVLRNTYMLLGLTFMFSAAMAYFSFINHTKPLNPLLLIVGMYGLMFLTQALRNSVWGLVSIFAFTGFLGFTLGPILNAYMQLNNGGQLIATALGGTGIIFFALSGYVLTTRKDFNYLGGFLFIASMIGVLAIIASLFFQTPALQLMVSAIFMLIASGLILFQTSAIIHGGETNYIMATISLFVSIFNLFLSLLQILGAFSNSRD